MKRFLSILVVSMFLGSAVYAAEPDRKVGFAGEEKKADEKAKSDAKAGPTPERKARDSKVGFTGEEKKAGEKTKSDAKAGPTPERKARDSKVGFAGEEKKSRSEIDNQLSFLHSTERGDPPTSLTIPILIFLNSHPVPSKIPPIKSFPRTQSNLSSAGNRTVMTLIHPIFSPPVRRQVAELAIKSSAANHCSPSATQWRLAV